jgi:RHS repeat-associated protein
MVFDPITGLYNDVARWYSTSISTFISQDPIGYRGGGNLYEYVGDNPATATDPKGTDRYITRWGQGVSSIHAGVAVDTWAWSDGKWTKTGQKTFDFSVSSIIGVVPSILIWWGKVTPSNGLNLVDPITCASTPCEDRVMLQWCEDQVKHPLAYSFIANNCLWWSVWAINVGMGTDH